MKENRFGIEKYNSEDNYNNNCIYVYNYNNNKYIITQRVIKYIPFGIWIIKNNYGSK